MPSLVDAYIPFSGRNPRFQETLMVRPHLLLLNKVDLAGDSYRATIETRLRQQGIKHVLYTNCRENVDHTIRFEVW